MKKLFYAILVFSSLNVLAQNNTQQETTDYRPAPIIYSDEVTIKSGDTKIIPLRNYTFIDRISLEIKTTLLCGKDRVEISFDGTNKNSLSFENGFDGYRTKIITANTYARNIEVYNQSSCKVKIKEIQVLPRRFNVGRPGYGHTNVPASEAGALVSYILESFLYLDPLVGDADRVAYISPVKKALGRALSVLNTSPETSQASLAAIKEVIAQLNQAKPLLDKLLTVETTFEISTEVTSSILTLERIVK